MAKVAFFHGIESPAISEKNPVLEDNFDVVYAPRMNYKDDNTLFDYTLKEIKRIKPDYLIGSSMGGWFAYCLSTMTGIPTLLFNPAVNGRSFDPIIHLGNSKAKHTIILGKSDDVINPKETIEWFKKNGMGNFDYHWESFGHRIPLNIFTEWVETFSTRINEEWSTETASGTDWSFLPENTREFLVPNFLSSKPTPGFGLTVECNEIEKVINEQKNITEDDRKFIASIKDGPCDEFYKAVIKNGDKIKKSDIDSIWNDPKSKGLIEKIKSTAKKSRPYWTSESIKPVEGTEVSSYSFPSGYSVMSWLVAKKLTERFPKLKSTLEEIANKVADSRVKAGVHFPSDIKPAKKIAECMIKDGY